MMTATHIAVQDNHWFAAHRPMVGNRYPSVSPAALNKTERLLIFVMRMDDDVTR